MNTATATGQAIVDQEFSEGLHWLEQLMEMRKRTRERLVADVPEQYRWLCEVKKTQVAAALLKLFIDYHTSAKQILCWPRQCLCDSVCYFCVRGNAASVLALIEPVASDRFRVNFVAWWKRYVRCATPRYHQRQVGDTVDTYACFLVLQRPDFFRQDGMASATVDTIVDETITATTTIDNAMQVEVSEAAAVAAMQTTGQTAVKQKQIYRCNVCGMPKKGHVCRGVAPPPLPSSDEPILSVAPPRLPPPLTEEQPSFNSIFVLEDGQHVVSRLERLFGPTRLDTGRRVDVAQMDTDISVDNND
jgi:hypothetical protein